MSQTPPVSAGSAETQACSKSSDGLKAHIHKRLASQEHEFTLEVDFKATVGFTILFGPSGAGKTTLLDCIAGLSVPDSGCIEVADTVLFDSSHGTNVAVAKRRIGYVFQSLALFPHLSVEQNVAYGLSGSRQSERSRQVAGMLQQLHIADLAKSNARQISGGESQRVALARTLVTNPALLLLDEPLAALDAATKSKIIDDLRAWNGAHGIPIIYVTHSREEVFALGERVLVLDRGRIIAQGTPHEVMSAPVTETVAQLAGFENVFDAVVEESHPERGTMLCRVVAEPVPPNNAVVRLETPLVRANVGSHLRVGIRAGDILLATARPQGLSARNVLSGVLMSLEQRDMIVVADVACGVRMQVHLTLAARDSLALGRGREVWLVIKTHSCHLMQG